jgi:septum formation protein
MNIILSSHSPRRRELLSTLGLDFTVQPGAELDESTVLEQGTGDLRARLQRLALIKGQDVARSNPSAVVISADTVVEVQDLVLGKPRDSEQARTMLEMLSGCTHRVLTAVALQRQCVGFALAECEITSVTFDVLSDNTIERYIARATPFDKAGAYAIQGLGALLVQRIDGDYSNVVGLPLRLTARLLATAGIEAL